MGRIRPFNGNIVIAQEYGVRDSSYRRGYHTGVDYALTVGHEVVAPEDGTVQQNGDGRDKSDGRGFFVLFKGDSGVMHCLYHLREMGVASGRVSQGTLLGWTGNTGASTGPHLHWETRNAPFDGNSDFAPGTWLFAGNAYTPPVNVPAPTKDYVRIFGDFRTFYAVPGARVITKLLPNQLGGGQLTYEVLERQGNFVKIQTQSVGTGWIYVGADVANLTQFYSA